MTVNFNFKCHRVEDKQGQQTVVNSFPCNGVAFNSKFNTMATCGSDGTYVFWDKDNRQKLKSYAPPSFTLLFYVTLCAATPTNQHLRHAPAPRSLHRSRTAPRPSLTVFL